LHAWHGSCLDRSVSTHLTEYEMLEAESAIQSAVAASLRFLATQARLAYRYFSTQKYGCFCGKGTLCQAPIDKLDECCLAHDRAYNAVKVNVSVDMWTPLGFRLSRTADLALVSCAAATRWDAHWYGPAAAAYREALILIFSTRAEVAQSLESLPGCIKNNGITPVWNVDGLLARCP
jgi:hypothetical protein